MATVDSKSSQKALDMILSAIGKRESNYKGQVTIRGKDPILASRHRFGELMAAAQAALGMGLSDLMELRGGKPQSVTTSVKNGVHQHHGIAFMRQNGRKLPFMEKIGESDPIPLPKGGKTPFGGLRVLDCTHVIGGPITGRTLAEFGADVLHISKPNFPDHMNWRLETDIGKRSAYCDFNDEADKRKFFELLQKADVFTCSYLDLDQKGISPKRLAASKPGIIAHELRCFDFEGEWANFRGFDMMAVTVSGYVDTEGAVDAPMMPVQVIFADYLAAYAGSAGIAAALYRRATEGGSYQVRVSLTRMCMWAQELGLLDASALNGTLPFADIGNDTNVPVTKIGSPFGEITYLPSLIEMPDIKPGYIRGPQPLGSSLMQWT